CGGRHIPRSRLPAIVFSRLSNPGGAVLQVRDGAGCAGGRAVGWWACCCGYYTQSNPALHLRSLFREISAKAISTAAGGPLKQAPVCSGARVRPLLLLFSEEPLPSFSSWGICIRRLGSPADAADVVSPVSRRQRRL